MILVSNMEMNFLILYFLKNFDNFFRSLSGIALAQILTELEYENKFRFTLKELMSIKNVGNILDAIEAHLSK